VDGRLACGSLMLTDALPQVVGHGEDQVNGGDRQEFLPALCQPCLGVLTVACGATTMAAGVVDVVFLTTGLARQQVSAQRLRPAVDEIVHRAAMAGQEPLAEPCQIGGAIVPQDGCHLWHARAPALSEIGHEGSDGGVHGVQRRGRQRCLAGRGPQAFVAQQVLNDSPRHAPLPQLGRLGVPPRMDGGLCGHTTLAHRGFEGLVERGGGQRS